MNTLAKYQIHIDELAEELGCRLIQRPELPGMMYVEHGYIEIPTIENQIHYYTSLHELGHFHFGHTQGRPPKDSETFYFDNGVLRSEAEAWDYTLSNTLDEPTEATRRFMWDFCLGSYYSHYLQLKGTPSRLMNGDRHYILFTYDHPNEYFESVMKRIQGDIKDWKIQYVGKYKE